MGRGVAGLLLLLALAWACSEDRSRIAWRVVIAGVALQLALALLLAAFPPATVVFLLLNDAVEALQRASDAGTAFVFGYLGGGPAPFDATHPEASFILAFKALPLFIVISALASLLFYWGVLQAVTRAFAWLLRRSLGIGGALALGAAVHVFVGMIEAPLLIRPYLARLERGEMFALMSCGMAGIAGTVMAIYATILQPVVPGALQNILVASVISTPAALAVSALMIPFGPGRVEGEALVVRDPPVSTLDAIVKGTLDGIFPMVSIAAVLLVAVALVSLLNMAFAVLPLGSGAPVTLQAILAWPLRPVMWLIGIPWAETGIASTLMATKTVLNEFVSYVAMAHLPPDALDPRSRRIMTYAMCGFANFGSAGIMVGGMGALVPERRAEVVTLGLRSIVSGTIATCMSGAVAGLL